MAIRDREAPFTQLDAGSAAAQRPPLELHAGESRPPVNGDSSSTDASDAAAVAAASRAAKQPQTFGFEVDNVNQLVTFSAAGMFDIRPSSVTVPFAGVEMAFHQILSAKLAPVYQTALGSAPPGNPFAKPF